MPAEGDLQLSGMLDRSGRQRRQHQGREQDPPPERNRSNLCLSLLQLQRHGVDSFNVQLVYATGVNDLDALSVLPKVIRLRNEHVDAMTRHHHVTIDDTDDYRKVVGTEVHRFTAEA